MRKYQLWNIVAGFFVILSIPMFFTAYKVWIAMSSHASHWTMKHIAKADGIGIISPGVLPISVLGEPYYVYPKPRTNTSVAVTMVIILAVNTKMESFETARNSIECYAALHGYTVLLEFDDKFTECAVHKDKFFRRHCHMLKLMQTQIKEDEWAMFLDGDVGVINPNRLIEEYLEEGYEIYLFDRFYKWEYAALSYLVKNNDRGRRWVEEFAMFEFKLPHSFHGTDNGALHPFLMNYLVPETRDRKTRSRMAERCLLLWNRSKNYDGLYGMQGCTRMVIGERVHFPEHKVKIYQKGDGWAHDLWIFHSHWSTDDFMMHSLKEENFKPYPSDEIDQLKCRDSLQNLEADFRTKNPCLLVFPVLRKLNISRCKAGREGWLMEGRLQIDNETRRKIYDKLANRIWKEQMELMGTTPDMLIDN